MLVPGTEARLVDEATGSDVGPGEPGELWIRGPQVMTGYLGRAEETAAAFERGSFKTGDVATVDDAGGSESSIGSRS